MILKKGMLGRRSVVRIFLQGGRGLDLPVRGVRRRLAPDLKEGWVPCLGGTGARRFGEAPGCRDTTTELDCTSQKGKAEAGVEGIPWDSGILVDGIKLCSNSSGAVARGTSPSENPVPPHFVGAVRRRSTRSFPPFAECVDFKIIAPSDEKSTEAGVPGSSACLRLLGESMGSVWPSSRAGGRASGSRPRARASVVFGRCLMRLTPGVSVVFLAGFKGHGVEMRLAPYGTRVATSHWSVDRPIGGAGGSRRQAAGSDVLDHPLLLVASCS